MKEFEFKSLRVSPGEWNWLADFLSSLPERPTKGMTLLYGYDLNRSTVHVYLAPGGEEVVKLTYDSDDSIKSQFRQTLNGDVRELVEPISLVPDKRLYPARCDFAFCKFLLDRGIDLSFTTFEERPLPASGFYGLTL